MLSASRRPRTGLLVPAGLLLAANAAAPARAGALDALTNRDAGKGLRAALGQGIEAAVGRHGLRVAMNRAAESAVAEARPVLRDALKRMTLEDAKAIRSDPLGQASSLIRRVFGALH